MLVDLHEKKHCLFFFSCIFVLLNFSVCLNVLTLSYNMYKTQKMPAHMCIYKLMLYIHFIKYLFYISEYKAMLIQLLICHIYIYIKQKVPIRIPLKYRIDKQYR